jgi:hypothetical protein
VYKRKQKQKNITKTREDEEGERGDRKYKIQNGK